MKKLDRFNLIDEIAKDLQQRMTYTDIDSYLVGFGLDTSLRPSINSKRVYVKELLAGAKDQVIMEIVDELEINRSGLKKEDRFTAHDLSFWRAGYFRIFISHLAEDKVAMVRFKKVLEVYGISAFVAHEDIYPTQEWQIEIEKALFSCDALVAVLIPNFNNSNWTDQEIGIAIGRDLLVVPIRKGLNPYGFVGKYQGFQSSGKSVEEVAEGVFQILAKNEKTRDALFDRTLNLLLSSQDKKEILFRLILIQDILLTAKEKVQELYANVLNNERFNDQLFLERLNQIFKDHGLTQIEKSDFKKEIEEEEYLPF